MKAMILEMLITSSLLIAGIFGLRKLTMGKISMRLRYGLWLLVAVRLLAPLSVGTSPVSVMNLFSTIGSAGVTLENVPRERDGRGNMVQENGVFHGAQEKASDTEYVPGLQNTAQGTDGQKPNIIPAADAGQGESEGTVAAVPKTRTSFGMPVVVAVWFIGFLAVGGGLFVQRYRFARYLRRNRRKAIGEEIPEIIGEKLAKRGMRVYRVKGLPSPCLVGRCIYIGERTPEDGQRLTHVLTHEYCHRVHGDGLWAFLRCALVALYWFDPLVWAAAFAARQDSDLACDEAAVSLLGEKERFSYGRTLLALLQESGGATKCPGMPLMFSGSEHIVRERIVALADKKRTEAVVVVAVLAMVLLICGCAFTGAETQGAVEGQADGTITAENSVEGQEKGNASAGQSRQMVTEESNGEFARIQREYAEYLLNDGQLTEEQIKELEESAIQEAQQAAFEEALNYHGVMEGKDDGELSLNRQVDMQHFYEYGRGEREDAPEDGWYLLCSDEENSIAFYGLFTEDFGCRGVKTLIGDDVNTFDLVWYPTVRNGVSANIRVLERAQDGLPRRFVWKYMEEESSDTEIERLASGYRYDTGTVDMEILSEEDYLSWADRHLTYRIDEEREQVRVSYDLDGSGLVGVLDISAYAGIPIEEVRVAPDTVAFDLDSEVFEGEENIALDLCVGLKLAGYEDIFIYGLSPIAIQVLPNEDGDGFRFDQPKVDEKYTVRSFVQERKLEEIRSGADEDALAEPLENSVAHHDVEIAFTNPCPDYDRISDSYGERTNPVSGEARKHNGVDLAAPLGTDVLAAADGTVYRTGYDAANGNYVVLWHGESGQMTYYTCCQEILVSEGDHISAGDKIATVGQTGRSTGSHLHFAVSYGSEWQEPVWEGKK